MDILTRTIDRGELTPEGAYGTLRALTPNRSSFLLEFGGAREGAGRYSIVGYRTLRESMYPGGGDALRLLADDVAALPPVEELAARFATALVGYIAYDLAHILHDVEPWPGASVLSRMMNLATVAVFDHQADTITLASSSKNTLGRIEWEMKNGPKLAPIGADAGARPEYADPAVADDAVAAQIEGARAKLGAGGATEIVLSRRFVSPQRDADPFDVYRALSALDPTPYRFFLEFAETPMAPGLVVLGASRDALARHEGGDADPLAHVRAAFPGASAVGAPHAAATRAVRALEEDSRDVHGGAVGYFLPGGGLELAVAAPSIVLRHAQLEVTARIPVAASTDPAQAIAGANAEVAASLAAIRAAHDAAQARAS